VSGALITAVNNDANTSFSITLTNSPRDYTTSAVYIASHVSERAFRISGLPFCKEHLYWLLDDEC
jgi:hypothetical protein